MGKNTKERDFKQFIIDFYYFLKYKLKFDDFQACVLIFSIFSIPINLVLGFNSDSLLLFELIFYFTIVLDIVCIIYTILKIKKIKNTRSFDSKRHPVDIRKIKTINEIDQLSGLDFEKYVAYMFQKKGYKTELTKESHDRGADIIAEKGKECIIIQAKRQKKSVSKQALYDVYFARKSYKGTSACIVTNSELTAQAMNVANENGIQVYDRSKIRAFIRNQTS